MQDNPTFLNLNRGNRLSGQLGLSMDEGSVFRFSQDYCNIQIPGARAVNLETEKGARTLKEGVRYELIGSAEVNISKYTRVMIEPNPELFKVAELDWQRLWEPGESGRPRIYAKFFKPENMANINWLYRLYLLG